MSGTCKFGLKDMKRAGGRRQKSGSGHVPAVPGGEAGEAPAGSPLSAGARLRSPRAPVFSSSGCKPRVSASPDAGQQPLHRPSHQQPLPGRHREPRELTGSRAVAPAHFPVCSPRAGAGAIDTSPLPTERAAAGSAPGLRSLLHCYTHNTFC